MPSQQDSYTWADLKMKEQYVYTHFGYSVVV